MSRFLEEGNSKWRGDNQIIAGIKIPIFQGGFPLGLSHDFRSPQSIFNLLTSTVRVALRGARQCILWVDGSAALFYHELAADSCQVTPFLYSSILGGKRGAFSQLNQLRRNLMHSFVLIN